MTALDAETVLEAGIDAAAIKPAECDVSAAAGVPFDTVAVDFEGREHLPDPETLGDLATEVDELRVTVPVRADGYDPLGDDAGYAALPPSVDLVLVAGNPAYLSEEERGRAIAPRLDAAVERARAERTRGPWVGTEGIERAARATGATQFLLLSPTTVDELAALRADGFPGDLAVYAPTVLTDDPNAVLEAVGAYVARRRSVAEALPPDASIGGGATGRVREVLLDAAAAYALVGSVETVRERVGALRDAGADRVVGYPARGLSAFGVADEG